MKYRVMITLLTTILLVSTALANVADMRSGAINQNLFPRDYRGIPVERFTPPESQVNMEAIRASGYEGPLDLKVANLWVGLKTGESVAEASSAEAVLSNLSDIYWSSLGSGTNGPVNSLCVFDNKLIAGGGFSWAGAVPASGIAAWNGSSWAPLGSGIANGQVLALVVYDNKLIVGGGFNAAGEVSASNIAAWDGSSWSLLGSGTNGPVNGLCVFGNKLIAGGNFSTAGDISAEYIASWDGSSWSALGSGMNGNVSAMTIYPHKLIAGGSFTMAGGISAEYIASWDGSSWSPLGLGMNNTISALSVYDNELIVGGQFTTAGGFSANRIASWDGSSWSSLGSGMTGSVIYAFTIFDNKLIVGGGFSMAGGISADNIAAWDETPFIVVTKNNSGYGSLREAIDSSNADPGIDTIRFAISDTIRPISPLPALIDDSTVILGSTAPGGAHSVIIDGAGLTTCNGLVVQSCNNKIEGLTIRNFPGSGIEVSGALSVNNMLANNLIYNNAGLAIDLNNDGVTLNDPGDLDTGPNDLLNYPEIDSVFMNPDSSFTAFGKSPSAKYLEFYIAHPAGQPSKPEDPSGHGEAYSLIGFDTASGIGAFDFIVPKSVGRFSNVSAIAIDDSGNTSEFSENFTLAPSPLIIVAYWPVNLWVIDPDGFHIGKDAMGNLSQTLFPATYTEILNDSVNITHPKAGEYEIVVIPEEDAPVGAKYGIGIRIDGSDQAIMIMNAAVPPSGTTDTVAYTVQEGWHFINGDANRNGVINALDVTYLINYLYKHGPAPNPIEAGDANCNGVINALDVTRLINFLYKHGPAPCQI